MSSRPREPRGRPSRALRAWSVITATPLLVLALISLADTLVGEWVTRSAIERLADAPAAPAEGSPYVLQRLDGRSAAPRRPLILSEFSSPVEIDRWIAGPGVTVAPVRAPEHPDRTVARVTFRRGSAYGIRLRGIPRDWRGYDRLEIDVHLEPPSTVVALGVRIDDRRSDEDPTSRYEVRADLGRGWNRLTFPVAEIGAAIDLTAVRELILYSHQAEEPGGTPVLTFGRVALAPSER